MIAEKAKNTAVVNKFDVIVCGASPAGISAELAAINNTLPSKLKWQQIESQMKKLEFI